MRQCTKSVSDTRINHNASCTFSLWCCDLTPRHKSRKRISWTNEWNNKKTLTLVCTRILYLICCYATVRTVKSVKSYSRLFQEFLDNSASTKLELFKNSDQNSSKKKVDGMEFSKNSGRKRFFHLTYQMKFFLIKRVYSQKWIKKLYFLTFPADF